MYLEVPGEMGPLRVSRCERHVAKVVPLAVCKS